MILECIIVTNTSEMERSRQMAENLGIYDEVEEEAKWAKLWVNEEEITRAMEVIDETFGQCLTILVDDESFIVKDTPELRRYLDTTFYYREEVDN